MRLFMHAALAASLVGAAAGQDCMFEQTFSGPLAGKSVALGERYAVMGDPALKLSQGRVWVLDPGTGVTNYRLMASDGVVGDQFGFSVAVDGELMLVGAPKNNTKGNDAGAVYLIDLATGQEFSKVYASDPTPFDRFGSSVAIWGDRIVVGAPFAGSSDQGQAYVFNRNGDRLFVLRGSDSLAGDEFGASVAVHRKRIVVGAPKHDAPFKDTGGVYVFDADTGAQILKLQRPNATFDEHFGWSVDVWKDRIIAGAPESDIPHCRGGGAFLFDAVSGQVIRVFKEMPEFPCFDELGASVAIDEELIVIGAPGWADNFWGWNQGAYYLYDNPPGALLLEDVSYKDARLGESVSVYGRRVLAGGPSLRKVRFRYMPGPIGTSFCSPARRNSTGQAAQIEARGDSASACGGYRLIATSLPPLQITLFLGSPNQGFVPCFGGGQGVLCLDASTLLRLGRPRASDSNGKATISAKFESALAGETWNFQAWFRDKNPGSTTNFTDAVSVTFN